MRLGIALASCSVLVGCAADGDAPVTPAAQLDLRAAFGADDVTPIGLAIAPDGKRFVFDETRGLYWLDRGTAVPIVKLEAMPNPGAPVKLPYTDMVAIDSDLFALTAIGDGYLLDTKAMTLRQHFCYLPSGEGGEGSPVSLIQRTDGVAYDAAAQRIYAQPITYDAAGVYQYGQIASYDRTSGSDVGWYSVGTDVVATGMIVLPDTGLVLGQGWKLSTFDPATSQTAPLADLYKYGVRSIDGIALDPVANTLVVVDKQTDAVFDLDLAQLAL